MIKPLDFTKALTMLYEPITEVKVQDLDHVSFPFGKLQFDVQAHNIHHESFTHHFYVSTYMIRGESSNGLIYYDLVVDQEEDEKTLINMVFDTVNGDVSVEWFVFYSDEEEYDIFLLPSADSTPFHQKLHDITVYLLFNVVGEDTKCRLHFATQEVPVVYLTEMPPLTKNKRGETE